MTKRQEARARRVNDDVIARDVLAGDVEKLREGMGVLSRLVNHLDAELRDMQKKLEATHNGSK